MAGALTSTAAAALASTPSAPAQSASLAPAASAPLAPAPTNTNEKQTVDPGTSSPIPHNPRVWLALLEMAGRTIAQTLIHEPIDGARYLISDVKSHLLHQPQPAPAPAPTLSDLAHKFPRAGLPQRMVGTTVNRWSIAKYGPQKLMATAKKLGFNTVRVGAYWDQIQPNGPHDHDFSKLDQTLDAAHKFGLHVILEVGAKAPAWPEYQVPTWANPQGTRLNTADHAFQTAAENFVKLVATHERSRASIVMWQAENEPFDQSGPDAVTLPPAMVAREVHILHTVDHSRRPVMINNWSESDRRAQINHSFALADAVGIDVYPKYEFDPLSVDRFGREIDVPSYALNKARATGKPALISELQDTDWKPFHVSGQDVTHTTQRLEQLGYRNIMFWDESGGLDHAAAGKPSVLPAEARQARKLLGGD